MKSIKELQSITLDKVENDALTKSITSLLEEYEKATDKTFFLQEEQSSIEKLYMLVKKKFPKAIPSSSEEKQQPVKAKTPEKSKVKVDKNGVLKEEDKKVVGEINEILPDIELCRQVVKRDNAMKKQAKPPSAPKTIHTKLREKLMGIVSIIPKKKKKNTCVLEETEKIILEAHSKIIKAWDMGEVKAEQAEKAIKEKFDDLENKAKK